MSDRPLVKLFALSTCGHCRNTKRFLEAMQVHYDVVEVDLTADEERRAVLEEVKKYNPNVSFPTIIIGETVIVGFKEQEIRQALGL